MQFSPGKCPKCREYVFLKQGMPLLLCPLCDANISSYEASQLFDGDVSSPQRTNKIIAACLKIESEHGPELALAILETVSEHFPKNEEAAYLCVKMSGFDSLRARAYLEQFAHVKKRVPFANDFLENALTFRNLICVELFETYIENKLPEKEQSRWRQKLVDMFEVYATNAENTAARVSIYLYYIIAALLNVASAVIFILADLDFLASFIIVAGLFFVEITVLFFHQRKFGDRVNMSDRERLLMVIFMCSIVVAIGGMVMGALF